jgi:hypothetical protein
MNHLDPETRRNLHYAALPGKAVSAFFVLLVCLFAGVFGMALVAYIWGVIVRQFLGGF